MADLAFSQFAIEVSAIKTCKVPTAPFTAILQSDSSDPHENRNIISGISKPALIAFTGSEIVTIDGKKDDLEEGIRCGIYQGLAIVKPGLNGGFGRYT